MPYVRLKKIGNNYYFYEQHSYRVNGKVKTKHIRYHGKDINYSNPHAKDVHMIKKSIKHKKEKLSGLDKFIDKINPIVDFKMLGHNVKKAVIGDNIKTTFIRSGSREGNATVAMLKSAGLSDSEIYGDSLNDSSTDSN